MRATDERPVREVLARLPSYRAWGHYSAFVCPACGKGAHVYFDEPESGFHCVGGCAKPKILEAAERYSRPAGRLAGPRDGGVAQPVPHASERRPSWPNVDYELARLRVLAEAEALFAEEQTGPDDAWVPMSLTTTTTAVEPTILRVGDGPYLLRRGQVCLVSGLPGSAKTPLAYLGVVDAVRRGETVIIIDHEMGHAAGNLLRDLGLTDSEIDMQVVYFYDPPPMTESYRESLVAALDGRDVSYVVIDALADSMPAGASQNDAADVTAWFASLPKWFAKQFNAAVLVIDHSNKEDGPAPGGSVRKQGVPDFRMWLRLVKGFSKKNEDGCSELIVQRDRTGTYGRSETVAELRNKITGDQSVFVLQDPDASTTSISGDGTVDLDFGAMPAVHALRLEILEGLRAIKELGYLTKEITGDSGAESQRRKKALDWLVKDGLVAWSREPGSARGRRYWAVEFAPGGLDD